MTCSSETFVKDDGKRLECSEKRMLRWMCNATVRDGLTSEKLISRLGILSISKVMRTDKLFHFSHVEKN